MRGPGSHPSLQHSRPSPGPFLQPGAPGTRISELSRVPSRCPARCTSQSAGVDLDLSSSQSPQTPALPDLAAL